MTKYKKTLEPGIHVLGLPISEKSALAKLFQKDLSGSAIEKLGKNGTWMEKEIVLLENNQFVVSENYKYFYPLDTIRLTLKRKIHIDWDLSFSSHSQLSTEDLSFELGFDFNEALYLAQLSQLVYDDENRIKETIESNYQFDDFFYYSKTTHRRIMRRGFTAMLFAFLRGKMSIVDLQFMCLKKYDVEKRKNLYVIVFQGSQEPHDWLTNFSFRDTDFYKRGKVHQGFYHSLKHFFQTLKKNGVRHNNKILTNPFNDVEHFNQSSNIILAGHSLGGAIATLAGCYLVETGIKKENIEIYSFGAPPIGTQEFCQFYEDKINLYRLVNSSDVVPKLDKISNLFHIGEEISLYSNEGEVHSCEGYIDNIIDNISIRRQPN